MTKRSHCARPVKCWIPPFNNQRSRIPITGTIAFSDPGDIVFTVPNGATFIEYFIIGGGGGGAGNNIAGSVFSKGGGGGGGRGPYLSGSFNLDSGNIININVGSGGMGGIIDGTTGGTSSITYGIQNIIAPGGNPGLNYLSLPGNGGTGGNDSGGGGGGGGVWILPGPGGSGGAAGQGIQGQNGDPYQIPVLPAQGTGGNGGGGGNGVSFPLTFNSIFSGLPGIGGSGGIVETLTNIGGGGGGAGGVGTTNPLIQAQNGTSTTYGNGIGNGKGGFGYGSGGGGTDGRLNSDPSAFGGNGFSGLVVIKYS